MIIQALLTLLLFFSEGYVKYTTIGLFLLIDFVLFVNLLTKKWSFEELLTLAAIFCSGLFMLFYVFMKSTITTIFGIALMLLFLVIAMLDFIVQPINSKDARDASKFEKLSLPQAPMQYYDVEYDKEYDSYWAQSHKYSQKRPEPVMHVTQTKKPSEVKSKLTARAVAYELEREAQQLKSAEKMIKDLKIYDAEKELLREAKAMEDAEKRMKTMTQSANNKKKAENNQKKAQVAKELKKEAAEIMKAQKQINEIKQIKELQKEAASLNKAEKQVKEIQFLNQQEKIVTQAKAIAKAQKDIDTLKNKKPAKQEIVKVKTVKAEEESFYFATENGNKFHEPGCLAIKKVPKNKLTLFTSKKEAMKKGLQPCNVCIPK